MEWNPISGGDASNRIGRPWTRRYQQTPTSPVARARPSAICTAACYGELKHDRYHPRYAMHRKYQDCASGITEYLFNALIDKRSETISAPDNISMACLTV